MKLNLKNFEGHQRSLDGLRGIAILLVLGFHLFRYIYVFSVGWIGVDLFFVLSGYLITGILLDTVQHEQYWKNFFFRRILRIFPLYYFAILLFILLSNIYYPFAISQYVNYDYFIQNQLWYWSYLVNWKISLEDWWLPVLVFNPFWSLCIEEQFYILWPIFVKRFNKKLLKIVIVLILIVLGGRIVALIYFKVPSIVAYTLTAFRIDTILIGALVAMLIRIEETRKFLERFYLHILSICITVLLAIFVLNRWSFHAFNPLVQMYGYTFVALTFAVLLLIAINSNKAFFFLRELLKSRVLVFFGKFSYSIYVFHWPFYLFLREDLSSFFSEIVNHSLITDLIISFITLVFTILFSQFTWHFMEKRFLYLKMHFSYSVVIK